MDPWWNEDATVLVDHIRGGMAQATLFRIKDGNFKTLRAALRRPLGGSN